MQECGGFNFTVDTKENAVKVAEAAKRIIGKQDLRSYNWKDYMKVSGKIVEVDEDISIGWEDFDGLFEKICLFVEEKVPGAILSGEAHYRNVTGGFSACVKAIRSEDGLAVVDGDDDSDCEEGYHICMACGDEFPESECVFVENCDGWFCNDCYENSF